MTDTNLIALFVRPFNQGGPSDAGASSGGKWQISTGPADDPSWSGVRHELFYLSTTDLRMMMAPYSVENGAFKAEKPQVWAETHALARPRPPSRDLVLHPDGMRRIAPVKK